MVEWLVLIGAVAVVLFLNWLNKPRDEFEDL